jgi:15-cis-phytoene desaturase
MDNEVIVVGAGLAGLSCAFELAEGGLRPLVLEANPWLGGRTSSWTDPDGMEVESGLHRVLGVYSAFPDLLKRAGIEQSGAVIWEDEVEFKQPLPQVSAVFKAAPSKHPVAVIADLFSHNDYLSPPAKLSLGRFMTVGIADYSKDPAAMDRLSVLEYATQQELHPEAIARILEPLTAGIYFVPAKALSAAVFMALITPYLPEGLIKMRVGAFAGGMSAVMADPLAAAIRKRGGEVITSSPVESLLLNNGRVTGVRVGTESYFARHVVLASSLRATQRLLRPHFSGQDWARTLLDLGTMPGITIQLELDGPCMPVDHTTFGVGTALACFSEQSRTTFRGTAGRLSVILAPSDQFADLPQEKILEIVLEDADRLGLRVRGHVQRYRVVRHIEDFYTLAPCNDHLRPTQATPVPGLSLAGDFTRQPYVATMEGAVVSGALAAKAAAQDIVRR